MTESDGEVLARMGVDAAKWTDEFMKINPDVNIPDAWGVMVGWFANAIEAGKTDGYRNGFSKGFSQGSGDYLREGMIYE